MNKSSHIQAVLVGLSLLAPNASPFLPVATRPDNTLREEWVSLGADRSADEILECTTIDDTERLKRELFQLGASYDRGFGASRRARQEVLQVIEELERCNLEKHAARGIEGNGEGSPLQGQWRMIWTTAIDVLLLQASPIFSVGAIYQVFEPPIVTNIIDFIPRVQSLFPPDAIPNSLVRAKVQTRAKKRENQPNRVGLVFEKIILQPLQVLGQDVDIFPPLGWDLPKLPGTDSSTGPGYFDVTYLDDELLIIRQNAPGGIFALLKVDSIEA